MDQRKTYCPYCGTPIVVTLLSSVAQLTVAHLQPLCLHAVGAVNAAARIIEKLPLVDDDLAREN